MSSIEYINSVVLTSDQSSITFSDIPQNYTDLTISISAKQSILSSTYVRINSLSTNIYSVTGIYGNGTSAASVRYDTTGLSGNGTWVQQLGVSDNNFSHITYDFFSYSNTNIYKTVLASYGANSSTTGTPLVGSSVSLAQVTDSINSLNIRPFNGNWTSGSTFTLWGVK